MLDRPPRAPFPRKSEGKRLKKEGVMVVVVVVLDIVVMRRESMVAGGITGELEGNCEKRNTNNKCNLYKIFTPNFKAISLLLMLLQFTRKHLVKYPPHWEGTSA